MYAENFAGDSYILNKLLCLNIILNCNDWCIYCSYSSKHKIKMDYIARHDKSSDQCNMYNCTTYVYFLRDDITTHDQMVARLKSIMVLNFATIIFSGNSFQISYYSENYSHKIALFKKSMQAYTC